jgi:hypothetical protein
MNLEGGSGDLRLLHFNCGQDSFTRGVCPQPANRRAHLQHTLCSHPVSQGAILARGRNDPRSRLENRNVDFFRHIVGCKMRQPTSIFGDHELQIRYFSLNVGNVGGFRYRERLYIEQDAVPLLTVTRIYSSL